MCCPCVHSRLRIPHSTAVRRSAEGMATTSDCADVTVADELEDAARHHLGTFSIQRSPPRLRAKHSSAFRFLSQVVARSGDPDLVSALTPEPPDQSPG